MCHGKYCLEMKIMNVSVCQNVAVKISYINKYNMYHKHVLH